MISARRAAAYGLVSALAGMSTGHLVAALLAPESSPVLAVGTAVIDATPRAVKEWAVSTLGTADKPVLLASVSLGTAALAAVAGLLARRRVALGGALVALLGALALAAAITRPASTPLFAIPSLLAAGFGLATLRHLFRREAGTATLESPLDHTAYAPGAPATPRRRSILTGATGIGVGSALVGALGQSIIRSDPATNVTLPAPATPASALPTGLEATVPGVSSLQTPVSEFYRIDTALTIPRVDPQTWALTIDGMVDREVRLTFADILAMDLREIDVTINCVSNEVGGSYIGAARWTGVLVKDLLARAGVRPEAEQAFTVSVDGMTISVPLEALMDDRGALLAIGMNGAALPAQHGFPARLITPGMYGYVGATKWVERLHLTTYAKGTAYWSERGWSERAEVKTQTRIDTPRSGDPIDAGDVAIAGVAWSQAHGGITRVEVSIDGGEWLSAQLGAAVGPAYWRQWYVPWKATTGKHEIRARAYDAAGTVQDAAVRPVAPDGATGYHVVEITVQ